MSQKATRGVSVLVWITVFLALLGSHLRTTLTHHCPIGEPLSIADYTVTIDGTIYYPGMRSRPMKAQIGPCKVKPVWYTLPPTAIEERKL